MKTEITITIDPTNQEQVQTVVAMLNKLVGVEMKAATLTTVVEEQPKAKPAKKVKEAAEAPQPPAAAAKAKELKEDQQPDEKPTPATPVATVAEIKIEDVRSLLAQKVGAHRDTIKAELTKLGAANVSTLDPSKYQEFHTFLTSLK